MQAGEKLDHYRLERDLGAGAFATVWLATDEFLDAPVAIKVLADNWARNEDVRRRFIDEAKIMRRIDHDRIVRVFAVDELPSGQPMFVMTYADRGTLADRIRERTAQSRRFSTEEVAAIGSELASCLAVVHDFGVIHRDLKPTNVLFRTARLHDATSSAVGALRVHHTSLLGGVAGGAQPVDEVMVLADFGLAKDTVAASGFTMAAGTPAYMPPEQARTTSELDHRADIYSATAIVFELLTGRAPFDASSLSGVGRSRAGSLARLDDLRSDIPDGWQHLIDTGMAPEPADRFDSATDFADAIRLAAGKSSEPAPHAGDAPVVIAGVGAPSRPLLTGIRGRVDNIVQSFDVQRSAAVDRRLLEPCTIAVVGSASELDTVVALAEGLDFEVVRLAATDVRVGDTDLVVLGDGVSVSDLTDVLAEAPAGPVRAVSLDDDVAASLMTVGRRSDMIRASAALASLDATVGRAGSVAMSESWMRVGDLVEAVRFDVPALADLAALRAEVAGRLVLPEARRVVLRRVLFEADAHERLGCESTATEAELLDAAVMALGEWREYQDSGRVPFASRSAVECVVRSVERLWATLSGYTV